MLRGSAIDAFPLLNILACMCIDYVQIIKNTYTSNSNMIQYRYRLNKLYIDIIDTNWTGNIKLKRSVSHCIKLCYGVIPLARQLSQGGYIHGRRFGQGGIAMLEGSDTRASLVQDVLSMGLTVARWRGHQSICYFKGLCSSLAFSYTHHHQHHPSSLVLRFLWLVEI